MFSLSTHLYLPYIRFLQLVSIVSGHLAAHSSAWMGEGDDEYQVLESVRKYHRSALLIIPAEWERMLIGVKESCGKRDRHDNQLIFLSFALAAALVE